MQTQAKHLTENQFDWLERYLKQPVNKIRKLYLSYDEVFMYLKYKYNNHRTENNFVKFYNTDADIIHLHRNYLRIDGMIVFLTKQC